MGQSEAPTIAQVAALLTIGGAGIYILGLIAVAWPIYFRVAHRSPSVTLFAVSRIPRIMIAGYGMRIFRIYPLRTTLTMVLTYAVVVGLVWLVNSLRQALGAVPPEFTSLFSVSGPVLPTAFVVLFIISISSDTISRIFSTNSSGPNRSASLLGKLLTGILFGLPGVLFALQGVLKVFAGHYFSGLVSLLIGSLIIGVPCALLAYPPLPEVEITRIPIGIAGQTLSRSMRGRLLDHTGNSWYFFDDRGVLVTLPDSQVEEARIYESK